MEISIKWNVCRICLIEENKAKCGTAEGMKSIFDNDKDLAKQIYECTGIMVAPNDNLPEKICKKCLLILNSASKFRKICRESDEYLQSIIQQTRSTSNLFKLDRKDNSIEILEEACSQETLFGYENDGETNAHMAIDITPATTAKAHDFIDDEVTVQKGKKKTRRLIKRFKQEKSSEASSDTSDTTAKTNHSQIEDSSLYELANVDYLLPQDDDDLHDRIGKEDNYFEEANVNQFFESGDSVTNIHVKSHCKDDDNSMEEQDVKHNSHISSFTVHPDYMKLPLKTEITKIEITEVPEVPECNDCPERIDDDTNHLKENNNEQVFIILNDIKSQKTESIGVNNDMDEQVEFIAVEHVDEGLNRIDDASAEQVSSTVLCKDEMMATNDNEDEENDQLSIKSYNNGHDGTIEYIDDAMIDEPMEKKFSSSPDILNRRNQQIFIKSHTVEKDEMITNGSHTAKRSEATPRKSNPLFICNICGNRFTNRQLMSAHMRIHRQEKPHECELCFKRFITACNLQAHMRIHTGEKPYKCQYCGRRFSDRSTHLRHERTHTNEKPFTCNVCSKAFSLATTLQAHLKVHTGERLYKCEPCSKSFKLPHQLKAHQNSHLHKSVERLSL